MHKNDKVLTINDVWIEIGKKLFLEPSLTKKPNIVIQTIQKENGIDLKFWYETSEDAEYIMKMKLPIMQKIGFWFDSGSSITETYIEWNLDSFSPIEKIVTHLI